MGDWDFGDTSETLILKSADGYHLLDSLQNYSLLAYNIPFCVRMKSGSSKNVQDIL